jgi:hypothetical protein
MTRLEEELQDAIFVNYNLKDEHPEVMAAARVAKKYIEYALDNYESRLIEVRKIVGKLDKNNIEYLKYLTIHAMEKNGLTERAHEAKGTEVTAKDADEL